MKKTSVVIALIIAVAAICITMVICGETQAALAVIGAVCGAVVLGIFFRGLFGFWW